MVAPGVRSGQAASAPEGQQPEGRPDEVLYESECTRVRRLWLPSGSVILKEALGAGSVARIRNESAVLQRLAGIPGVPRLAGASHQGEVMLADDGGVSLAEALRTGAFPVSALPAFALRLTSTVAAMHRRHVVHKDINPANIVLAGGPERPVLVDFDLATTFTEDRPGFAHHSQIVGTLAYLPPEQTGRTGLPVDHRADLYALGALLYEIATGRPPFGDGDQLQLLRDVLVRVPAPLAELDVAVPPALSDIVAKLLEKEPDRRYQSAEGLARDLALLGERPQSRFPLGEWDFPPRLTAPSKLVGRDAEIAALRAAFENALSSTSRCALVAGAPGVGKSALINELRPIVSAHGGWFVVGKSEQFRPDAAVGSILQAIRGIGRLLLAESETEVASTRERLQRALGANLALVTAALPEFGVLMGTAAEPVGGDPAEIEVRQRQGMLDLLGVVVSPAHPVVMVVDDLQWADPTMLRLLDAVLTGAELPGLLVVGAFRTQEVDAAHPLSAMLTRWDRLGVTQPLLRLENLPPAELSVLLGEVLRLPPGRAGDLAGAMREWTAGNPYDTMVLVNTLRRDDVLVLGADGWTWDEASIRRYVGHGDVVDLLKDRIGRLPTEARDVLQAMACLGGELRVSLIAAATAQPVTAVREYLTPPLEDGLLILDHRGGQDRGRDDDSVRFRHDRVYQAAYASLDPARRSALQLAIGRRLAHSPGNEVEAAEQYLATTEAVPIADERRRVAELYRAAATAARRTSNYGTAERFLTAACAIWDALGTAADDPALVGLEVERHAALYSLGRLDEADEVYARIERRSPEPADLAVPACVQVSSLSQRNQHRAAVDLGMRLLARLGQAVPGDDFGAELPARLDELVAWVARLDLAADLDRPEIEDRRVLAVEMLFNRLLPCAFFVGEPAIISWMVLESQRMWAEHGPAPGLAAILGCTGLVAVAARQDYRVGYPVGRHVLTIGEARGYEPETSVLRHRYALFLMPWMEPLENSLAQAQLAREGLLRGGDLQMTSHTSHTMLTVQLETGRSLETYAAEIEATLAFAARTGNHQDAQFAAAHQQLLRALRGETGTPGGFDDGSFATDRHLAAVAANRLATGAFHICRSLAAAVFGDADALARHSALAMTMRRFVPGYLLAQGYLLRALSLAEQVRRTPPGAVDALRAELNDCREWLAERAVDAPVNFRHLVCLVDAERAWALDEFQTAIVAFDMAAQEAASRERPWHRALIAERAGYLCLAYGMERTGRQSLAEARNHYQSWGAGGKVRELDRRYPFLRTSERPARAGRASSSRRTSTVNADNIDMLAILRASQALSSGTNLDRLHTAIVEQLTALTGATDVLLVLRDEETREWFLPPAARTDGQALPVEEAGRRGLLPITAFRYTERTREPLLVEDAVRDDRFAGDAYLAGLERCSLLVVPIVNQGHTRAVLALANQDSGGVFTADRLDAVRLITGQLIVSLGNALLYDSLERRVADRTEALAAANQKLEILSSTDALTELANRRRFDDFLSVEWNRALRASRPIAIAMIDIDHFKRYNDHYGHPAGDECLRRVARALGNHARITDLLCRYGGEEFANILPETDVAGACRYAERAHGAVAALRLPHAMSETGVVTVSVGVAAVVPAPSVTAQDLLGYADAALYEAKAKGRNQIHPASAPDRP